MGDRLAKRFVKGCKGAFGKKSGKKGESQTSRYEKQECGEGNEDAKPKKASPDPQKQLAERMLLEQSIAGVVNGKTGLLMSLDILLHDAEEKSRVRLQAHAESYFWRMNQLKPLYEQYKSYAVPKSKLIMYEEIFKVGEDLGKLLDAVPGGGPTDAELDEWKSSVLRRINLYGDRKENHGEQ